MRAMPAHKVGYLRHHAADLVRRHFDVGCPRAPSLPFLHIERHVSQFHDPVRCHVQKILDVRTKRDNAHHANEVKQSDSQAKQS